MLIALFIVGVVVTVLELTNTTHLFHKTGVPENKTASEYTKGEKSAKTSSSQSSANSGTNETIQTKNGDTVAESAALVQPSGNFVSSHHVNSDSSEVSTCNTTPSANCTIQFTKDGVTKSLEPKKADAGGATYWNWKPADIGLSSGTWTIQAKATLGGQSQTASDALSLTVQ